MKKVICLLLALLVFPLAPVRANAAAQSYAVIEKESGRVLFCRNADIRLPMASTTKVMTAILVLENMDMDTVYTVPDEAVGVEGSSIYLEKGEELSVRQLLYGLMLASGNDAAYALAILAAGSAGEFVLWMNLKAATLGLRDTHFENPCGLHHQNHYTTANDLARLCAYAMKNEAFAEIVSTMDIQIPSQSKGVRYLHNKNRVLGEYRGGNGIKTGYTRAAGRCLCASATRDGMTLISVVLNDPDWFRDAEALLTKGFEEFSLKTAVQSGQVLGNPAVKGRYGRSVEIRAAESFSFPIKEGESLTVEEALPAELVPPLQAGQRVPGAAVFLRGSESAGQIGTIDGIIEQEIK